MKNFKRILYCTLIFCLVSINFQNCSSGKWIVPNELIGEWKSARSEITVRSDTGFMKFAFTSDFAEVSIKVNEDKTVSGSIGLANFEHGKLRRNSGNPEKTGVAFIIECGLIGKIFPKDPENEKEVEIWLGVVNETISAELRFTDDLAAFPMGDVKFVKVK